jgi:hypothetical protein
VREYLTKTCMFCFWQRPFRAAPMSLASLRERSRAPSCCGHCIESSFRLRSAVGYSSSMRSPRQPNG